MRRVGRETCQREARLLEVLSWEAFEDYLGVAPIRPGRHRYRQNEAGGSLFFLNKGGTARILHSRPFLESYKKRREFFILIEKNFFTARAVRKQRKEWREHESNIEGRIK